MSDQPVAEQVPLEPTPRPSLASQLLRRGRLLVFAAALAIELAIFFGAMVYPIDPAQQTQLLNQANALMNSTSSQGPTGVFSAIFDNNVRVALIEMIPAAGAFLFGVSMFTTGQVIQALAISSHLPGPVFGLALFFFPFALVELSSYAVAAASGTMLIVAWRRKTLANELRVFVAEGIVVVIAVLIAAVMEAAGIVDPVVGLALWLPTILAIAAFVIYLRGRKP
jgi:Stage II sporulation protein M